MKVSLKARVRNKQQALFLVVRSRQDSSLVRVGTWGLGGSVAASGDSYCLGSMTL